VRFCIPEIVFLEVFQDGGFYPSFASTAVISPSCDHRDGMATFPGLITVRIWKKVNLYPTPGFASECQLFVIQVII